MKCGICDEEYVFDLFVTDLCPRCMVSGQLSAEEQDDATKVTLEILDLLGIRHDGPPYIRYVKIELFPHEFPAVTVESWCEELTGHTIMDKYRLVRGW